MIKLSELIDKEFQPSEKAKMKNFLNRGSRDQENVYKEPDIYEDMIDTSNHPEDHNMSNGFNKGYPWDFEDPSGIYESEELNKIHQALIGREFQTLQDLAKITSRLRQRGFAQSDIEEFLRTYLI
jgi:predicted XRE-type DNA-binding protein